MLNDRKVSRKDIGKMDDSMPSPAHNRSKETRLAQRTKIPFVSVVAPAFNERENVEAFYQRLSTTLNNLPNEWEIICVDDGSSDDTRASLERLHAADNRVIVVPLSRNFGKEIALTAGLDHAKGDIVIPIDFDLQDPPELIPDMLAKWAEGYDVVYATRTQRDGESWFKKFSAHCFYRIANGLSDIAIPVDTGDFRLMDRKVLDGLALVREKHRFMKGLFAWVGFKQTSIAYDREERHAGTTKWNYWALFAFAVEGITSFSTKPLQIATYLGFTVSIFSFIYGLYTIAKTLIFGIDVPGYASILVAVLFFGGVQLIVTGILGEYIGRIYNEVKNRPLYLVDKDEDK